MSTLDDVPRRVRHGSKAQPHDPVDVFREFLAHLDRAARRKPARTAKAAKVKERRGRK